MDRTASTIVTQPNGLGLAITGSQIARMATKAEAFAACGEIDLYRANAEMLADVIESLAPVAAAIRAELASTPSTMDLIRAALNVPAEAQQIERAA